MKQISFLLLCIIFIHFFPKKSFGARLIKDTVSFFVTAYDGLQLPAQVIHPDNGLSDKIVVFINGSTPSDEKGNIAPVYNDKAQVILKKQDFYIRFRDFMPSKGYSTVTMAKRSFVEPAKIPRPTLDELALDVTFLINELKAKKILTPEKKLYLVGYSEGSIVASKVLGWLKEQPEACILLGSGCDAFDFHNKTWEDWPNTDIYRKIKNWSDEQLQTEYEQWKDIVHQISNMDETTFETEFKNSRPHGFGFAQWESYHIDKEVSHYYPQANLIDANIPLLICIGENDISMPEKEAEQTYRNLVEKGFTKATFCIIPDEGHQYKKFDVFGIIDSWITSGYTSTDFKTSPQEQAKMEEYLQHEKLISSFNQLPYEGGSEAVLEWYNKVKTTATLEPGMWFSLGVKLFGNGCLNEAYNAFSRANQP
ncbi:MAG TPA: prolyl oligopeptidase family serine peptidase, partial [Draconibacterium sp.]|nr:prolyl oligopeptidase family serine peptidase [Draconibacterium sp.]